MTVLCDMTNSLQGRQKANGALLSVALCWVFYLFAYITRVEPSVLTNDLMSEFGMTSSLLGFVISIAYIPYVAMQIPCGIITDKLGTKTMIFASCIACSLGVFVFGSAQSVLQLEVGRFLVGLSTAAAFLCCGKVATEFFDKRRYAMLMGIAMCMGCLGGISGSVPTAYLVSKIGWRNTTYAIATFGILLSFAILVFMKKSQKQSTQQCNLLDGLKLLAKNPKPWLIGFYGAMTYLPLSALAELWVVPFMEQRYGISTEQAAISSTILFIGFALGSVISAWVAEKINSYKKTIIFFTIGSIFFFWFAIYDDAIEFTSCLALLLGGGICAGANNLSFTFSYHLVPPEFGGTSTGFTNALVMSSAALFQPLLGRLLDFFRNGLATPDGTPIYNLTMYRSAFMFVMAGLLLAIFAALFVNDVKHKE
ncbi:MAG: MFS transporter [Alphaproteobacteria bacterium]|nr:MFS transporter [Alphaproteobacteria bacterium]